MLCGRSFSSSQRYFLPFLPTSGIGMNGSRRLRHAHRARARTAVPPCGVLKVLCRFMWMTSKPISPGRTWPRMALRLAPS